VKRRVVRDSFVVHHVDLKTPDSARERIRREIFLNPPTYTYVKSIGFCKHVDRARRHSLGRPLDLVHVLWEKTLFVRGSLFAIETHTHTPNTESAPVGKRSGKRIHDLAR